MNNYELKIIGSILLCLCSLSIQAEEFLMIHLKSGNGHQLIYALPNKPVITFEGMNMVVLDTKMNTTTMIPIANVAYYELVSSPAKIQQTRSESTKPIIAHGHVMFTQLPPGSNVSVYTMEGQLIRNYKTDHSGSVDINLSTLSKGVYIIKSPFTSIKVTNR